MSANRGLRSWVVLVAAFFGLVFPLLVAVPPAAATTPGGDLLQMVNDLRVSLGLKPMLADPALMSVAQNWSAEMAQTRTLDHNPNYSTSVPAGWTGMAENIGYGPDVQSVFNAFKNSPSHYANMTRADFNLSGWGAVADSVGTIWVTEDFEAMNLTGRYIALPPARLLDTRNGTGAPAAPVGPNSSIDVQATGMAGVPSTGVAAVVLNVTVTGPTTMSYLTTWPTGATKPLAANLVFTAGQTIPNVVEAKVGANGKISFYNAYGSAHIVADVAGWYSDGTTIPPPGGRFGAVWPSRLFSGPMGTNQSTAIQVTGQGGLPSSGVGSVALNITVSGSTALSYLTAYPTGGTPPLAANLVFQAGQTITSLVMAKVGTGGKISLYNLAGTAQVTVDVIGWFTDGSTNGGGYYTPLTPARILDTRSNTPVSAGSPLTVQVTGQGGVPASGVTAVVMNVTVTQPSAAGSLTVSPAGVNSPSQNVSFVAGQTVPNLVVAWLGSGGKVSIGVSSGNAHVVVDVAGWYS